MVKKSELIHPQSCAECQGVVQYITLAEKYKKPGEVSYLYCTSCGLKYTYVVPRERGKRDKH